MSSTNRGSERRLDDAYMTPTWCVRRLLDVWEPGPGMLIEPCAGTKNIVKAVGRSRTWWTNDIRELPGVDCVGDFLSIAPRMTTPAYASGTGVATVITNPPYSLAEEFLRHSRRLFPRAELVFLLRMAFAASAKRLPLWQYLGTPDVYVLPNRPSFTGEGTDSADYAWFVFPEIARACGDFRILAETPASERRVQP